MGNDASIRDIMREQIGDCPHRDDTQLYTRCDPYFPTLARLFSPYPDAGWSVAEARSALAIASARDRAMRRILATRVLGGGLASPDSTWVQGA